MSHRPVQTVYLSAMLLQVRVYSAATLQELVRLSCYPSAPREPAVLALGHRWLAVPADQPPTELSGDAPHATTAAQTDSNAHSGAAGSSSGSGSSSSGSYFAVPANVTDAAQGLVGSLYYLGGVGRNGLGMAAGALSASLAQCKASPPPGLRTSNNSSNTNHNNSNHNNHSSKNHHHSSSSGSWSGGGGHHGGHSSVHPTVEGRSLGGTSGASPAAAGSIAVVDVVTGRAVVHFQSYRGELLAALGFSSSGRLLASAAASGQTVVSTRAYILYK
jgi:hypothetical protein